MTYAVVIRPQYAVDRPLPRTTVDTLEEARDVACGIVHRQAEQRAGLFPAAAHLPADGGEVGPLPDGSTILVYPVHPA